ncbi:MAG: DUF763 domain-containing protein, partial [Bacteroidota bacterium]
RQSLNPHHRALGLYVCGGKGSQSRRTPYELTRVGELTGLDADTLVRSSKLAAKVDNTAIQDGFQLYMHNFVVSKAGDWTIVQQGMKADDKSARRYHWHSADVKSFVLDPHSGICGEHQGEILNLVDRAAQPAQKDILKLTDENPQHLLNEIPKLELPQKKGVTGKDVNLKRLSSILWLAHESQTQDFESLLLLKGLGPRTLQSLTLVSEVIHGSQARFSDPARFTFAHGSKGGNPYPVPTKVYDETIEILEKAVSMAKMGNSDRQKAIKSLARIAERAEEQVKPKASVEEILDKEKKEAWKHGGRTMKGYEQAPPEERTEDESFVETGNREEE